MRTTLLQELLEATEGRRPVVLATRLGDGRQTLIFGDDTSRSRAAEDGWPVDAAARALAEDRTLVDEEAGTPVLLRPYNPPLRLFIIGAVHVAQPLVPIAHALGMDVLIADPREAFASEGRFPEVEVVREWPDRVLRDRRLDARSAVVALTHDPKIDEPALVAALESPAFYVGALGSRTTHDKRLSALRERGVPEDQAARIRGPIGLDIGARSPAEIAVAVAAELIQHLRRPS